MRAAGQARRRKRPTPVIVPPVPAPATNAPTRPPLCARISGRWSARARGGWPGCRTDRRGTTRARRPAAARRAGSCPDRPAGRCGDDLDAARRARPATCACRATSSRASRTRGGSRAAPATSARPTPVLPAVASTIVSPGRRTPRRSASSTIASAMRSFTLPPGLRCSHFDEDGDVEPGRERPERARAACRRSGRGRLPRARRSAARPVVRLEVELEELLDLRDPAALDEGDVVGVLVVGRRRPPRPRTPSRARSGTRSDRPVWRSTSKRPTPGIGSSCSRAVRRKSASAAEPAVVAQAEDDRVSDHVVLGSSVANGVRRRAARRRAGGPCPRAA